MKIMKLVLVAVATMGLMVQLPQIQPPNIPLPQKLPATVTGQEWDPNKRGEHSLPEGQWCQNHKPIKPNLRAHECHCDYICVEDETNEYFPYYPTADCLVFCKSAHVQCTCHPEEPCPHPTAQDKTVSPVGLSESEWLNWMSQKHDELKHNGHPFK